MQNEKNKLKTQLKSQNDQLKVLQEENIVIKRPMTTGSSTVKKIREIKSYKDNLTLKESPMDRESPNGVSTVKAASSAGHDSIKLISMQMEQNKLHNLQTKQDLKEFRRKAEQEREKELTVKQKDVLIARLNIQVEERDKDISRLKNDYER
jgi:di/tripeptidase